MTQKTTVSFEQKLFKAADKLRKNIDAAEYNYVVLGLVFIKYISETFSELYEKFLLNMGILLTWHEWKPTA